MIKSLIIFKAALLFSLVSSNSAWGNNDCVDCGNNLTGTTEVARDLSRISHIMGCDEFPRSGCSSIPYYQDYDDLVEYFNRCAPNKSMYEVLRGLKCESKRYKSNYPLQYAIHLILSERREISLFFREMAMGFRKRGEITKFQSLINAQDDNGRTFLDFIDYNLENRPGDWIKGDMDRVRNYACKFGGVYKKKSQPSDCAALPGL